MERAIWKPARLLLLAGILGSSLWVLSRAIAAPKAEKAQQPNYSLPNSVPLKGWNLQASTALSRTSGLPAGQQYQYRQQTDLLDIEARILLTDGNVSRLLSVNTPLQTANRDLQVKYDPDAGYYGVAAYKGKAYLSACVNSRGGSTVTGAQFMQNRYKYDLRMNRILPWILGQESIFDQRCLWTVMSTPLPLDAKPNSQAAAETFKKLETAWLSWQQWWQTNFPPV